jgi:hypothetical protein
MATVAYQRSDQYGIDPSEIINNLFVEKLKLENSAAEAHISCQIMMINWSLENDLGLNNHEQLFSDFKLQQLQKEKQ